MARAELGQCLRHNTIRGVVRVQFALPNISICLQMIMYIVYLVIQTVENAKLYPSFTQIFLMVYSLSSI